jgi:hypothetical protein
MDTGEVGLFDGFFKEHEQECFGSLDGKEFFCVGCPSGKNRGLVSGHCAERIDG